MKDIKEYFKSPSFRGIIIGFALAFTALLIFQAGEAVGYRKATFTHGFGNNFYRGFDERPGRFMVMRGGGPLAAHGATGQIVSINLPTFIVAGPDGVEKIVVVQDDTLVRQPSGDVTANDLKVDDFVVVLGEPNADAHIEARLIRVMPFSPEGGPLGAPGMRMRIR